MRKHKPSSPRLSSLHGCPLIHLGAIGEADWRSVGIERYSSSRRNLSPRRRGFCIAWLAISAPWLPVNKFTVLTIEDPNTIDSELIDTPRANSTLSKLSWTVEPLEASSTEILSVREEWTPGPSHVTSRSSMSTVPLMRQNRFLRLWM